MIIYRQDLAAPKHLLLYIGCSPLKREPSDTHNYHHFQAIDIGLFASSLLSVTTGPSLPAARDASGNLSMGDDADSFFRASDASSRVTSAGPLISQTEMSALVSQVQSLPERVLAASWGVRQLSIINREEASLFKAMAMIDETNDIEGQESHSNSVDPDPGSQALVGQGLHVASITEVLDIVQRAIRSPVRPDPWKCGLE